MYKVFNLKEFSDEKGKLVPLELKDYIDFEVKRVYFAYDNIQLRGGHCHLNEKEFFFMTAGSCKCRIHDGKDELIIDLVAGQNAIYVANLVWHEFYDFSPGASLTALSSTNYNPNREDYIEDFNKFLVHVQ